MRVKKSQIKLHTKIFFEEDFVNLYLPLEGYIINRIKGDSFNASTIGCEHNRFIILTTKEAEEYIIYEEAVEKYPQFFV